jgi:hypothetical protein
LVAGEGIMSALKVGGKYFEISGYKIMTINYYIIIL